MADRFLEAGFSDEEVRDHGGREHAPRAGAARRMSRSALQVIGAHSADFVWRAGGAIAKAVDGGGDGRGDRALLRRARRVGRAVEGGGPDDRERQARPPRRGRGGRRARSARRSAAWTSATTRSQIDADALLRSPTRSARSRPTSSITHTDTDPFNPDHPVAHAAVDRARGLAAGAGRLQRVRHDQAAGAVPVRAPPARAVQLHADDVRRHHLGDRAQARGDGGDEGAAVPADLLRAARRAARQPRAARVRATREVRYAEAFQRVLPQVVDEL